ncbi:MAG: hypothetical protein WBX25_02020 [Rhodomicrobium sp.]
MLTLAYSCGWTWLYRLRCHDQRRDRLTATFSAQSGTSETNSKDSNVVTGGLTTRNSYIGFASDTWGSIKGDKTSAPYANSTAMMNPFSGLLGNYTVIMGNTGGDNRAEFNTLLDHAIWYESPVMKAAGGAFNFAALVSPGRTGQTSTTTLPRVSRTALAATTRIAAVSQAAPMALTARQLASAQPIRRRYHWAAAG